jgi:hypothetical protein
MEVFLKPQVYLFNLWKHEERQNSKESGGSVIKDIIYIYIFQENIILKMQFLFLRKNPSPTLQTILLHFA